MMSGPRVIALALLAIGLAVVARTFAFPAGVHGVPGPALVPRLLGAALVATALILLRAPVTPHDAARQPRAIAVTVVLLVAYAALWSLVPFGVLTAAILLTFLRLTGASWRGALALAVLTGATLQVVLEQVLAVRF